MNPGFVRAGVDDIIPFVVIVIFIIVRLAGFIQKSKEGRKPQGPQPAHPPRPERRPPSTLEDFFKQLAGEPVQPPEPAPSTLKRPDYLKEMEEFNLLQAEELEEEIIVESIPAPEIELPVPPKVSNDWEEVSKDRQRESRSASTWSREKIEPAKIQSLESVKPTHALLSGAHGLKMPGGNPLRIASKSGASWFSLEDRATLKNAMVSHIVFSPPRAYDLSFDNTIAKQV